MAASESVISLPFSVDAYGNITRSTEQSKIWMDRVHTVVGTAVRERVMRPEFGTKIPLSVFNNADTAQDSIRSEIFNAFGTYLPALTFNGVVIDFDEINDLISVDVTYSLPNNQEMNTTIGVATISGTKIISEEIR
ncbi:baseplate wedge subunit [uncultured Caudovirales phage]|uniref:Baseplate wedge subunit n=1 Tax=uncultured Caudovirales phage TaxID=2100421 RepID=A0A6J5KRQ2_9CAUD|nr:baseplate wedge subunit [uncultured Caudovirales phage]